MIGHRIGREPMNRLLEQAEGNEAGRVGLWMTGRQGTVRVMLVSQLR
jgi:hypothetical protein